MNHLKSSKLCNYLVKFTLELKTVLQKTDTSESEEDYCKLTITNFITNLLISAYGSKGGWSKVQIKWSKLSNNLVS